MMRFTDSFILESPVPAVWGLITDSEVFARCTPGLVSESLVLTGEDSFKCRVQISVAKVRASYDLEIAITERAAPYRIAGRIQGQDRMLGSRVTAQGSMTLIAEGANRTAVHYEMDVQVSGKIATFGYPIIKAKAQTFSKEFISALRDRLLPALAGQPAPIQECGA